MYFKCIHNNLRAIRIAIISMRMTTTEHFFDADDTNLDDYCWNCVARFMFMLPFTKNIYIVYQYHPDCNTCCAVAARLHFGKMHIACCFMRTHMPLNSKLSNFSIFNTLKLAEVEIIHWIHHLEIMKYRIFFEVLTKFFYSIDFRKIFCSK